MTTAMRRPAKFAAVLTAAAVLAAGCGSGATTANAAATIDGRTISVDDIQSRVQKVMKDSKFAQTLQQQHKLDLLSRSILTREVSYELTAKAAQRENLKVEESAVSQRVQQRQQPQELPAEAIEANLEKATDEAFDTREVARNELLNEELAKSYLSRLKVTLTGAIIRGTEAKKQAQDLARQLADAPAKATEIVTPLQNDAAVDYDMSIIAGVLVAQNVGFELATTPVISAAPNNVVAFSLANHMVQAQGENLWFVALIKNRTTNGTLSDQEREAAGSVPDELLNKIGRRLVSQYIGEITVEIGPRYGVWDPIGNNVAPRAEEVSGYLYPARAAKP
ncbi:MAG: SurA N-terminal domain-containing protein [Kibdelosporangium sp.]